MKRAGSGDQRRKRATVGCSSDDLAREIASLSALNTVGLRERWNDLVGADPSPHFGRSVARRITPLDVDAHVRAAYSLRIRSQN
jgi:hypothetical protein